MASRIHKRSCWRKIRLPTEYRALSLLHHMEKRKSYDGQPLKIYECSVCNGWHVAHVKPGGKIAKPQANG